MKNQKGFTLIELMVVVGIIGVLSAIAVPQFQKYQAKSRLTEGSMALASWHMAAGAFASDAPDGFLGLQGASETDLRVSDKAVYFGSGLSVNARTGDPTKTTGFAACTGAYGSVDPSIDEYYIAATGNISRQETCHMQINSSKVLYQSRCLEATDTLIGVPYAAAQVTVGSCS